MAKTQTYKVGDHLFKVKFEDDQTNEALLPSYTPFIVSNEDKDATVLFQLTTINEPIVDENATEIGQFDCGGANHGIYKTLEGGYILNISTVENFLCCKLWVNEDFSECRIYTMGNKMQRMFAINNSLMIVYAFSSARYGTLLMHSSVVMNQGKAYLCQGKSGTGKSTHTSLWLKYILGSELLNDDNPVVRYMDGKSIVYGSPWSGKTPCYKNQSAPIGGFLRIKQAPENIIKQYKNLEAFASILSSCSTMIWDKPSYSGICDTIANIIGVTPCYQLECLPNEAAAQMSFKTMVK